MPGPKCHVNSTFFRGLKPPTPSLILDLPCNFAARLVSK
jgi:hypothetical protein